MTPFKVGSEYVIIGIIATAIFIYTRNRALMPTKVFVYSIAAMILTICAELLFSLWSSMGQVQPVIGHIIKVISFWCIYQAIIETTLTEPFSVLSQAYSSYDAIPHPAIVVDNNGTVSQVNRAAVQLTGKSIEELIHKPVHHHFHPLNIPEGECRLCNAIKEGQLVQNQLTHFPETNRWKLISLAPIKVEDVASGMVQSLYDITDRIQAEKNLQIQKKNYHALFTSVNEGVSRHGIVYNQQGKAIDYKILEMNPAFTQILGIKAEEAVGKLASQVYGRGKPPYLDKYLNVVETGEPVTFETYFSLMEKHFRISVFSPGKGQFATLFADITKQKKIEEQIKASLREKEILLREIHHRVKNNMQVIITLLDLQSKNITDQQTADLFQESQNRIRAMALVHEQLYNTKDFADIDFKGYVETLSHSLLRSYGLKSSRISLHVDVADTSLDLETAIPCGLIINELVSNSLKYAFPEEREGEIRVAFHSTNDNELVLEVSDNGIGIPDNLDIENTESLGLRLVTMLAKDQLNGTIDLDITGGTVLHVRFRRKPLNKEGRK